MDVLHIKQLDELFQILNLFEKDLNLKGLEPHWNNITVCDNPEGIEAVGQFLNDDITLYKGCVFDFLTIQWDNVSLSQHDLDLWLP